MCVCVCIIGFELISEFYACRCLKLHQSGKVIISVKIPVMYTSVWKSKNSNIIVIFNKDVLLYDKSFLRKKKAPPSS